MPDSVFYKKLQVRKLKLSEADTGYVLQKRCSLKFRKLHRKTPVLESLFNKDVVLSLRLYLKKLRRRCFSVNFVNYLRAPILLSIYEQLVPKHQSGDLTLIEWKPDGLRAFPLIVLERYYNASISLNFVKFFGKLFCRTLPGNHFSDDVVLFFFFLQISKVCSLKSIFWVEQQ